MNYNRLKAAIIKHNPYFDDEGVNEALKEINESKFPLTLDPMDINEKIRAKLVGLSRTGGLEPITVTQNYGEGNEEKTVRLFDFDSPENNDFLVTNQFELHGLKQPHHSKFGNFVSECSPLHIIGLAFQFVRSKIKMTEWSVFITNYIRYVF